MEKNDIHINKENEKFNFRVAAIFKYKNKILIQKSEKDSFFSLIGGKVKLGETTFDALKREVKEEINMEINKQRSNLLRICENFFSYNFKKYHELLFIYCIEIDDDDKIEKNEDFICFDKATTKMCWINQEKLNSIDLRPKEAKDIILDNKLKHIVIRD